MADPVGRDGETIEDGPPDPAPARHAMPTIAGYAIGGELGRGAMGSSIAAGRSC